MGGEIRKVRIGSINGPFRSCLDKTKHKLVRLFYYYLMFHPYYTAWKGLIKSFDEYGYDTDRFGYIKVVRRDRFESERYTVRDGNHRLHILRERFGDEHFILVKQVKNYTKDKQAVKDKKAKDKQSVKDKKAKDKQDILRKKRKK